VRSIYKTGLYYKGRKTWFERGFVGDEDKKILV